MASILEHLVHDILMSDKIYLNHLAYKAKYFLIKHVCKTYRDFFKENTNKFHSVLVWIGECHNEKVDFESVLVYTKTTINTIYLHE